MATKEGVAVVPAFTVEAVITTGAGDSFWGGFLCAFLDSGVDLADVRLRCQNVREVPETPWRHSASERRGGIPAMPTLDGSGVLA